MQKERSAGAIVFRKEGNKVKYLLLYKEAHPPYKEAWDFPKGWVEDNEDEHKTASREVEEETGIKKIEFVPGFKERFTFFYKRDGKMTFKEVIFFLAETKEKRVKVSEEHSGYEWLEFNEAVKRATFSSSKDVLKEVNKFLKEGIKQRSLSSF